MLGLDLAIVAVVALFYKEFLAISFDEAFAEVENVPVEALWMALLCLIALTVVVMMRVVGLILVIALLTIPAAIAGQFARDLKRMMALGSGLGVLFTALGLWASYAFNLTSGATIILVAAAGFAVATALRRGLS
jgi:zinc transport system permease protein